MSLELLVLLGAAGVVTAAMTAIAGFGGGTVLIALLLQFMTPAVAIPFHGLVQLFSNGWRVWLFRKHVSWPLALRFMVLLPFGVAVGMFVFRELSPHVLQIAIGLFVLSTLILRRLKRFRGRDLPLGAFVPLGFVVGILNMLLGVVAPLLGVLVVRKELQRQAMVATLGVFALSGHALKVAAFGLTGFDYTVYATAFAVMIPAVMLGGLLGKALLERVSERVFAIVFQSLLLALSLKLVLWEGLRGLL